METVFLRNIRHPYPNEATDQSLMPKPPRGYLWRPGPTLVTIPALTTVRLTGQQNDNVVAVPCALIFADQRNAQTVSVGPSNMTVAAAASPNVASYQLDSGVSCSMWTDDVLTEFFDLGQYFAAHDGAAGTMRLYVTIFTAVPIGG